MKFTFFRKRKEIEQNRFRIAMLEEERDELIKKLSNVKLSKNEKINNLTEEVVYWKNLRQEDIDIYEKRIQIHEDIENSIRKTKEIFEGMNKKSQEKIELLEEKIFKLRLMIPEEFPVDEIMQKCSDAAWYGQNANKVFESLDGKIKLYFSGVVYEPIYEDFTAGCCVYYLEEGMENKKSLYTIDSRNVAAYKNETVETGAINDIRNYLLNKKVGFKEI